MAKSCKGLAMELVKCLSESDCVKVENKSYRECSGELISIAKEARYGRISTRRISVRWSPNSLLMGFDAMNLQENLLRGIYAYGFEKHSTIQQRGIVPFCKGFDVIQQAQSGTGKTVAPSALITSRCLYWMRLMKCSPEVARHCRNGQVGRTFANSTKETVLAELAMAQGSKDNISVVVIELSKSS
ncbi:hypothetical protein IFM89_035603 [Coptis chinensis]|uniref:DEAD-box RNA helicase Q domain-containing protein n=1 Tax=Coptis chinensis TaxID=261450 RepID=A0A835H0U7_9MAGN|nr:hypothetical protein IFM89_035603 [Coptis chinensis]